MDTLNAISSPGLADGPWPSSSPDGPELDLFGQALVPASHSPQPEPEKVQRTPATSGPCSSGLSPSAALSLCLGSKLAGLLDTAGSLEYRQTWRRSFTTAGLPFSEHIASQRPTNASAYSGEPSPWPTPDASAMNVASNLETHLDRLQKMAEKHGNGNGAGLTLGIAAQLAPWPTPQACEGPNNGTNRGKDHGGTRSRTTPQNVPDLVGWPTPVVGGTGEATHSQISGQYREQMANILGPSGTPGQTPSSSCARTEKRGGFQLNPAFSLWLMGYPAAWLYHAPETAMGRGRRQKG